MFLKEPPFKIVGAEDWRLEGDLIYFSKLIGEIITVPKGFYTDFASVPWFFQRIIPVNDIHKLASVPHDYLYSLNGALPGFRVLTRKECDKIFLEAMKVLGVSWWKRTVMYNAVRIGGGSHWAK